MRPLGLSPKRSGLAGFGNLRHDRFSAWINNGGEYATIKYFDGALIVRAPDYIHRQIGGYPKPLKPKPAAEEVLEKPQDEKP